MDGLKDPASGPLLDLRDVTKSYRRRGRHRKPVVDRISLAIGVGELVALVGESGSGKSTIGKIVAGLLYADSGTVRVAGQDYPTAVSEAIPRLTRAQRRSVQMVFQDSYSSLNPRRTVRDSIVAPLVAGRASRAEADTRLREVTDLAGLATDLLDRYPSQLSGGQRQRVAIARALVLDPGLIVADEAISALDVTAQQELIEMIRVLKTESRTSFLFITHDLGVARHLADRVVVLSPDGIQDTGTPAEVFQHPRSAYTRALIDAVPRITTRAS
nr:ABC transporter ATP-binding protein [Propionicicella superfundia]